MLAVCLRIVGRALSTCLLDCHACCLFDLQPPCMRHPPTPTPGVLRAGRFPRLESLKLEGWDSRGSLVRSRDTTRLERWLKKSKGLESVTKVDCGGCALATVRTGVGASGGGG